MFHFHLLSQLAKHHTDLTEVLRTSDFFLVWGCIRDVLLGIVQDPDDIDLTMWGQPSEIYENLNTSGFSTFITEKFGTITLIPKLEDGSHVNIKYELTPFRAESGYADARHPDQIFWSDSLVLDAQRRDFRINALYYSQQFIKAPSYETEKNIDDELLVKILEREGFIYLENQQVLIVQKESYLEQLIVKGKIDLDFLYYLLDIQPIGYQYWEVQKQFSEKIRIHLLIDPTKGLQSMISRKLQTVWEADKRFQEDALRLLRALRFVNVINEKLLELWKKEEKSDPKNKIRLFDFETETRKAIKRNHELLSSIAKERIYQELVKSFSQGNPFGLIGLIDEAEMLPILFPALAKTKHYDQPIRYHPFDIYAHIILTLYHLQQINKNYLVRFAMLYHDVGKVGQYEQYWLNLSKEEIRKVLAGPMNHRFSSGELMKEDFRNLGFSNKEIEEIKRYIKEHHTPWEILLSSPSSRAKKLKKLLSEAGYEKVQNLLDINIADRLGMYNPLQNSSDLSDSYYLKELLDEIENSEGQFKKADLAISWADIMKEFEFKPGKIIWELLDIAFDWVIWDVKNRNIPDQIFANLRNYLKHRKEK